MCYVSATELKQNLSHYIELSSKEDVYITKNNKIVSVLVSPKQRALDKIFELEGVLSCPETDGKSDKELIGEAMLDKCSI